MSTTHSTTERNAEQTPSITSVMMEDKPIRAGSGEEHTRTLHYRVTETPPIHMMLLFAIQVRSYMVYGNVLMVYIISNKLDDVSFFTISQNQKCSGRCL